MSPSKRGDIKAVTVANVGMHPPKNVSKNIKISRDSWWSSTQNQWWSWWFWGAHPHIKPGIAPIIAPTPRTRRQPKGLHRVADRSPWVWGGKTGCDSNIISIRFSMPKMGGKPESMCIYIYINPRSELSLEILYYQSTGTWDKLHLGWDSLLILSFLFSFCSWMV